MLNNYFGAPRIRRDGAQPCHPVAKFIKLFKGDAPDSSMTIFSFSICVILHRV